MHFAFSRGKLNGPSSLEDCSISENWTLKAKFKLISTWDLHLE